jgi:hypothetical protein
MSTYLQVHVRFDTIGEPFSAMTILLHEAALATIASQLDALEGLIAQYGAKAFFGEPAAEPPRQTA